MALSDYLRLDWFGQPSDYLNQAKTALKPTAGINITDQIESLDKFTDVGTGETCSASIMLRAHGGNFVTEKNGDDDNDDDPGATPIIRPFDLFRLAVVDDSGTITADAKPTGGAFWRWLIQGRRSPQKTSMGQHITLDLHGREWWLQQITFPGRYYFRNFKEVAREIISFYNDNGRSKPDAGAATYQPRIADEDNAKIATKIAIPEFTYGIFEFGDTVSCYDALMEIVRRLDLPVAAGGDGQHHGIRFTDADWTDPDEMQVRIGPRGTSDRVPPAPPAPVSYTEVREPPSATVIIVEGQEGAGTIPPQIGLFRGYAEEWNNLPEWKAGIAYKADAFVRHEGLWHRARVDNTGSEPQNVRTSNWEPAYLEAYMNAHDEKGKDGINEIRSTNPFQYSPWTEDKAVSGARNFMGRPDGVLGTTVACPDMNTVIRDDVLTEGGRGWRTWVDCRARNEGDIPARLRYPGVPPGGNAKDERLYHGLRILRQTSGDNVPAGAGKDIPQTDKFGKTTADRILVRDRDGDWIVFKEPEVFNEVAVLREGKVYEWNAPLVTIAASGGRQHARTIHDARPANTANRGTAAWRDISATLMGNDCFHYPEIVENPAAGDAERSLVPLPSRATPAAFGDRSAIRIEYSRNETAAVQATVTSLVGKLLDDVGLGGVADFFADTAKRILNPSLTDAELDELDTRTNPDQYNDGWWAVLFEAPFPKTTDNSIGEQVGALYGGGQHVSGNAGPRRPKVPLLDLQNQTFTPTGRRGWTAEDAEWLGQTSGFHLLFKHDISGPAWLSTPGNIPGSAIVQDHLDNVWRTRFSVRFQEITQPIYFPWSGFSIYRARLPVALTPANYVQRIIKPELAVTETFDPRLTKRILLQIDLGYDDEGRYDPWSWEAFIRKWVTAVPAVDIRYKGVYDAFCFVRQGLAVSKHPKVDTGELPRIDKRVPHPSISNAVQLRKIARAERDVAEHENDYISLKYERYCGLDAEQFLTITDEDFITAVNDGEGDAEGKLKMICKKITYSVTGRAGAGGLIADVELFRKVNRPRAGAITRP